MSVHSTPAAILATRISRTITGPMWHGPAVMELLRVVDARAAHARPLSSAHTVWELVLHMTTWADIARLRLEGRALDYPDEETDWPSPPARAEASAWTEALQRLADAYEALARAAHALSDEQLAGKVKGNDYSVRTMLSGVVEHGVYHGGQIAILLKAVAAGGAT